MTSRKEHGLANIRATRLGEVQYMEGLGARVLVFRHSPTTIIEEPQNAKKTAGLSSCFQPQYMTRLTTS